MTSLQGTWDVDLKTPIGTLTAVYVFTEAEAEAEAETDAEAEAGTRAGATLTGTASTKSETVPLTALTRDGNRVTWQQSVTHPLRLNLAFDVIVDEHTLSGHSRAGRLPRTTVTGTRRA